MIRRKTTNISFVVGDFHRLFVHDSCFRFAHALPSTFENIRQIAVLTNDELAATRRNAEQETDRAEISVRDPQVLRLDRFQQFRQQGTFLGMSVFARQHIDHQTILRVEDDESLPGQRCRVQLAQFTNPSVGPTQVVSIDDLGAISGHRRLGDSSVLA